MPFSDPTCHEILSRALERVARERSLVSPSVLDCGVGCGLTGKIVRDLFPGAHIVGLEVYAPYVFSDEMRATLRENWGLHHKLYDSMLVGPLADYRTALPLLGADSFDFVTFGDSLEHVSYDEARQAVAEAYRIARHATFATVPLTYSENGVRYWVPQGEVLGNPAEAHRHDWTREEMEALGFIFEGRGEMAFCFSRCK